LFKKYQETLAVNVLKTSEKSPIISTVNKVDLSVPVEKPPMVSVVNNVDLCKSVCDEQDVYLYKKLKGGESRYFVCKYNIESPTVRFCRNKDVKIKLSSRVLKDSLGYYLEITIDKESQELKKGTLLGVIKKSKLAIQEVPVQCVSFSNVVNSVHDVVPSGLTFTELLAVFADVEYIRIESRINCQGHGKPVIISVTKAETVKLFGLKVHAIKSRKKDNVECIMLQLSGPVGQSQL
jgi:hypothetical protein